jgi:hypothetical protein
MASMCFAMMSSADWALAAKMNTREVKERRKVFMFFNFRNKDIKVLFQFMFSLSSASSMFFLVKNIVSIFILQPADKL